MFKLQNSQIYSVIASAEITVSQQFISQILGGRFTAPCQFESLILVFFANHITIPEYLPWVPLSPPSSTAHLFQVFLGASAEPHILHPEDIFPFHPHLLYQLHLKLARALPLSDSCLLLPSYCSKRRPIWKEVHCPFIICIHSWIQVPLECSLLGM